MLEIFCKIVFFLSMLVAYAYVTSTSKVIVIVLSYSVCVFSYYYFNVIQSAIDEFFKFFNFNEKFMDNTNPSQVSIPYVNAVESASYRVKYPSLRQMSSYRFDKSTLRHLSRIPRNNSIPAVRIAPPEPISINLMNDRYISSSNDRCNEEIKGDSYFQAFRDTSRKRNYTQEETDRIDSTPKKSRKNDIKNFMSSHYKRSHDDSSQDSLEDMSRKKRCSDSDRSVAKMMSYTSSMSVIAPDFTWNNHSKKRKSSKIEKSKNESPEKVEKLRKIAVEESSADVIESYDEQMPENFTYVVKQHVVPAQIHELVEAQVTNEDEEDGRSIFQPPLPDDDGEYVKVASGKILNRTNCTYRKKLNTSRIDPESVISIEPELVNGSSNEDDDAMKKSLLKNLLDDIERKGEKDENVIFYENSIVEEIAKKQDEFTKPEISTKLPSSYNPLLSKSTNVMEMENKPIFNSAITSTPSIQSQLAPKQLDLSTNPLLVNNSKNSSPNFNSNLPSSPVSTFNTTSNNSFNNSTFNTNAISSSTINFNLNQTSNSLTFGNNAEGIDTVDLATKSSSVKPVQEKGTASTITVNNPINSLSATVPSSQTKEPTSDVGTPKNNFLFPSATSVAPSSTSAGVTTSANAASFGSVASPQPQINSSGTAGEATPSVVSTLQFGSGSSFKSDATSINDKNLVAKTNDSANALSQFDNKFNAVQDDAKKNDAKSTLSQITMFGNTAMSSTTTSGASSASNAPTTSSFATAAQSTGGGFQFGQSIASSNNMAGGFSFGSATNNAKNDGFKLGTSTVTTTSTSLGNSFTAPSVPTFGTAQNNGFGMASGGFGNGANQSQTNATFGNASNQSQTNSTFGGVSNQSPANSTFSSVSNQPQANPTFGGVSSQSQATPAFGGASNQSQTNITFGNASNPSQSNIAFGTGSNQSQANATFGNALNSSQLNLTFGSTASQAQPTPPAFGNNANQSQTNSAFGTNQTNAFGSTQMFGSGDTSNVFNQNTATPQFGATNTQFGSSGTFSFGSTTNNPPPAFGSTSTSTPAPFGGAGAAPASTFSTPSTFNFSSGSSSFGGGSAFGGAAPAKPTENAFSFTAPTAQAAPNPVFQFGGAAQPQPAQPFNFGGSSSSTAGGGFSIGAGGSSRNRANRTRRNK